MRTLSAAVTLLFVAPLFAQTATPHTAPPPSGSPAVLERSTGANCPVALDALKTPQGAVLEQTGRKSPSHALALNIVLRALANQPIRQAEVVLTGIAGPRLTPADDVHPGRAISERFTLTSGPAPKPRLESVVYTHQLTGIRTVSLTSITWADGTSWHAAPGTACEISPSLYLEVEATTR